MASRSKRLRMPWTKCTCHGTRIDDPQSGTPVAVLREVREALDRIQQNTYGNASVATKEIGVRRLKAVQWTPLCIACQERERPRGIKVVASPGRLSLGGPSLRDGYELAL